MYINTAGAAAGAYGAGDQRLNFIISAVNMATPGIMAVQSGFANLTAVGMRTSAAMNQAMTSMGAGVMAFGGVAALGLGMATSAAMQYEQQMASVQAISGQTTAEMAHLSEEIKRLSMEYGESLESMTSAMQTLSRAGIQDSTAQLRVFEHGLKMAKIEGADLTGVIENLVKVTGLFGGQIEDAEGYAELAENLGTTILQAAQMSPTDINEIMMGLNYVGGLAYDAGVPAEDIIATISYMATKGVSGSQAGVALRGFLSRPSQMQQSTLEALEGVGLRPEDFWVDDTYLKPLDEIFMMIEQQMDAVDMSVRERMGFWTRVAQVRTGQQIQKIEGAELGQFFEKMEEEYDIDERVGIVLDTAAAKFEQFKATLAVIAVDVGEMLLPVVSLLFDGLRKLFGLIAGNPVAAFAISLTLLIGAGMGLIVVLNWIKGAFSYVGVSAKNLKGTLTGLWTTLKGASGFSLDLSASQQALSTSIAKTNASINMQASNLDRLNANLLKASTQTSLLGTAQGAGQATDALRISTESELRRMAEIMNIKTTQTTTAKELVALSEKKAIIRAASLQKAEQNLRLSVIKQGESARHSKTLAAQIKQEQSIVTQKQAQLANAKLLNAEAQKTLAYQTAIANKQKAGLVARAFGFEHGETVGLGKLAAIKAAFSPEKSLAIRTGILGIGKSSAAAATGVKALMLSLSTLAGVLIIVGIALGAVYLYARQKQQQLERLTDSVEEGRDTVQGLNDELERLNAELEEATGEHEIEIKARIDTVEADLEEAQRKLEQDVIDRYEAKASVWNQSLSHSQLWGGGEAATRYREAGVGSLWRTPGDYTIGQTAALGFGGQPYEWSKLSAGAEYQRFEESFPYLDWAAQIKHQMHMVDNALESGSMTAEEAARRYAYLSPELEKVMDVLGDMYLGDEDLLEFRIKEAQLLHEIEELKETELALKAEEQRLMEETSDAMNRLLMSIVDLFLSFFTGGASARGLTSAQDDLAKSTDASKSVTESKQSALEAERDAIHATIEATYRSILTIQYQIAWMEYQAIRIRWIAENIVPLIASSFFNVVRRIIEWLEQIGGGRLAPHLERMGLSSEDLASRVTHHEAQLTSYSIVDTARGTFQHLRDLARDYEYTPSQHGSLWPLGGGDGGAGGAGTGGTGGTGTGAGGSGTMEPGGKGKAYTIDFILCKNKQLPPLDPNLFKRKPVIDLTRQEFSVSSLNVLTRDTPKSIEASVRNAVIDVQKTTTPITVSREQDGEA